MLIVYWRNSYYLTSCSYTAVVGASGSGKSTIGSLLLRYYEPNSGRVMLGGHDIKDINPSWIRSNIGTVSQVPDM